MREKIRLLLALVPLDARALFFDDAVGDEFLHGARDIAPRDLDGLADAPLGDLRGDFVFVGEILVIHQVQNDAVLHRQSLKGHLQTDLPSAI